MIPNLHPPIAVIKKLGYTTHLQVKSAQQILALTFITANDYFMPISRLFIK